jgi:hypothetical protein
VAEDDVQRVILPIPGRRYAGLMAYDAQEEDAKFAPIRPLRAPPGAA